MHRLSATLVALTLLLAAGFGSLLPAGAAPQGQPRADRGAGQEVGDTVALLSVDGDDEGSLAVTDLVDDFEETDERPPRGERMVSVDVEIVADGADIAVDPINFNVVDSNGVLWVDIDITRTDDKESLEAVDLADGDTVSGSLEIVIPTGVDIDKIIYIVDAERVLTLLDTTSGVEAGDVVDVFTVDGEESGTIVADELFEEFEDVERGSEPARGEAIYAVAVTAATTGPEPLTVGPDSFIAVDENGRVYFADDSLERTADSIDEVPDLASGEVAEGDEVAGFVGFVVDADVAVDYVAFIPDARFYPIVDEAPAGGRGQDDSTPSSDKDSDSGLGRTDDETPAADDETPTSRDETPAAGDCPGVAEWEDDALENVTAWGDAFAGLDPDNLDPDELRDIAADIEAIAEAQAGSDPPAEAEALNEILADSYQASARALEDLADGVEQTDTAQITEAAGTIQEIGESFQDGPVQDAIIELRALCGDAVDDL